MSCSRSIGIVAGVLCALALGLPDGVSAQAKLTKNLFSHVMKSADVDAQFAKIQDSWDVYTKTNHAVTFRVNTKKLPMTNHMEADEYWFVRKGSAKVTLQTGTPATQDVGAGDVVYVPRSVAYEDRSGFDSIRVRRPAGLRTSTRARRWRRTGRWGTSTRTDVVLREQGPDRQNVRRRTPFDATPFPRWRERQHDHLQWRDRSL